MPIIQLHDPVSFALPEMGEEPMEILQMLAEEGSIGKAAVDSVDILFGYADAAEVYQNECIERAKHNIIIAVRAAVAGQKFEVVEQEY